MQPRADTFGPLQKARLRSKRTSIGRLDPRVQKHLTQQIVRNPWTLTRFPCDPLSIEARFGLTTVSPIVSVEVLSRFQAVEIK